MTMIADKTAKHIPGPWHVDANHHRCEVHGPDNFFICELRGWGHLTGPGGMYLPVDEATLIQDANARLIAAAPDLLEACEVAVPFVEALFNHLSKTDAASAPFARVALATLRLAIEKADKP